MAEESPYFLDTCVPIYAAGGDYPYKNPCARLVLALAEGKIAVATDAEVVQELVYRFHAIDRKEEGLQLAEEFLLAMDTVLPITRKDIARALALQRVYSFLPPRDAIHVAVMEAAGLRRIVTADRHFDGVEEVERVDLKKLKVYIENVNIKKVDGTEVARAIDPSNIRITKPVMEDKMRLRAAERHVVKAKPPEKEPAKAEPKKEEKPKAKK